MRKIKILEFLNYFMALLFILAAVAQYNDPDGPLWMAVYGLAAVACILWVKNKLKKTAAITLAIVTLVWSALTLPDFTGQEAFNSFSMQSIEVEEIREFLGLLIISIWMLILAFIPEVQKKEPASEAF